MNLYHMLEFMSSMDQEAKLLTWVIKKKRNQNHKRKLNKEKKHRSHDDEIFRKRKRLFPLQLVTT